MNATEDRIKYNDRFDDLVRVNMSMDREFRDKAKEVAKEHGISLSAYVRKLILEDLEKNKKK